MIYFYGGAFNPMTKAHLQIIQSILQDITKDDKLVIAITNHDYKQYQYNYQIRKDIIRKNLVSKFNKYWLCQFVNIIEQTKRTWKFLNEKFKDQHITLVLGEDEYNDLKSLTIWYYSKEILDTFPIKVISRSGDTKDISATKVRQLLNEHANFDQLEKYITIETWNFLMNKN